MSSDGIPWNGDQYQARFDERAASGANVHGEADLGMTLRPHSVLDVGCSTGRVARELAARGVDVVGVDADASYPPSRQTMCTPSSGLSMSRRPLADAGEAGPRRRQARGDGRELSTEES